MDFGEAPFKSLKPFPPRLAMKLETGAIERQAESDVVREIRHEEERIGDGPNGTGDSHGAVARRVESYVFGGGRSHA